MNSSIGSNGGDEVQAHAKLFILNCYRPDPARRTLENRVWHLSASQKTCLFAVLGQEVGFSQYLQRAFGFKRLDDGAQVNVLVIEEDIEQVSKRETARRRTSGRKVGLRKLLSSYRSDSITSSRTEEMKREVRAGSSINTGKAHLQEDLNVGRRDIHVHEVHHSAAG